jgi:hypothetical protein
MVLIQLFNANCYAKGFRKKKIMALGVPQDFFGAKRVPQSEKG